MSAESQQDVEGFTTLHQMQAALDDVTRALERLDDGTYGTCQTCRNPIDDEVLSTRPATRFCPECPPASAPAPA